MTTYEKQGAAALMWLAAEGVFVVVAVQAAIAGIWWLAAMHGIIAMGCVYAARRVVGDS